MSEDTSRKTRRDAWWMQLTEEQQARARDRLRRFPWYEVAEWVAKEYGIRAPSMPGVYRFRADWDSHESEFLLKQRISDHAALERELTTAGVADPQKLASALGNDVAAARAHGDPDALKRAIRNWKLMADFVQREKSGDLQKQDLDLRMREFEQKLRTALENGLQALLQQVAGNAKAEGLVLELQKMVNPGEAAA